MEKSVWGLLSRIWVTNMNNQMTTAEQPVSKAKLEIMKESQRIEESALYSSKGHFVASYFWTNFHLCMGVPMVILAARDIVKCCG